MFVIQEYDPLTFPVGTLGAVTRQAYTFPHFARVLDRAPARLLPEPLDRASSPRAPSWVTSGSVSFRNAITSVDPPSTG